MVALETSKSGKMTYPRKQVFLFFIFLLVYGMLFYLLLSMQFRHDFPSFYTSAIAYFNGTNPYEVLTATFLPIPGKIPANLNPPFFLELMRVFISLDYHQALVIWSLISFCFGIIGAFLVFTITFEKEYLKRNWLGLLCAYLALYSTVMDTNIAQLGALLFLFVMAGYYFYIKGRDSLAGIFWGIIVAIKLFPALLFFLALSHKRYRVIFTMATVCVITWLLPLLHHGTSMYSDYFEMLSGILWFGDSWNASIYGFLFRILVDINDKNQSLAYIKILYGIVFIITLLWYLRTIYRVKDHPDNHRAFCFTLVMMLLLSPFGWMYYFSLIIMPLIITWQNLEVQKTIHSKYSALWLICLSLVNFPLSYLRIKTASNIFSKTSIYSLHFYGLLILAYLLIQTMNQTKQHQIRITEVHYLFYPIIYILTFGFSIPLITCLLYFGERG